MNFNAFLLTLLLAPVWVWAQPSTPLEWHFPLKRTHTGILLGNGTQGLMVWGEGRQLNVTVGRAGFWDRRGGNNFSARTDYQKVKSLLQSGDEAGLNKAFDRSNQSSMRPHQMGAGRVELYLPQGWALQKGLLHLDKGMMEITAYHPEKGTATLTIDQAVYQELSVIDLPEALQATQFELVASWQLIEPEMEDLKVSPPNFMAIDTDGFAGKYFVQQLPEDEPLCMAVAQKGSRLQIGTAVGENAERAANEQALSPIASELLADSRSWWAEYWADVPALYLPDPILQELYDYGLFKQGCATPPQGIACGLQGPFLESYRLPPWSADYHFNINIEMIYWPTLATGRTEHLWPLWEMLMGWMPGMQKTGEAFFGQKGAIMMPHAVDDRCQVVGSFWTGTIDHACAAWMAQLAWLHYRYSMDEKVLEEVAWPLLNGSFEGFWAMTETDSDGKFMLPVSVSPEFKGSRMDAWGKNASFQLAAYHMVAETLQQAAELLNKKADPRWEEVRQKLPPYTTFTGPTSKEWPEQQSERIALWEGMDLIASHRHHSHLAAIYPFATIDPLGEEHGKIAQNSIKHWVYTGAGAWSGWCVPWAATLQARMDNADAAVGWLHYFKNNYTNEGRGTLHDAAYPGKSVIASKWTELAEGEKNGEVMQLDGGFGAITAITELMVQHRKDGVHILPDIPAHWEAFSFEKIRVPGAFAISAEVREHQVQEVVVEAQQGGQLVLHPQLGSTWTLNGVPQRGATAMLNLRKGERAVLRRIN